MKHKLLIFYMWFVRSVMYFWPDIPPIMRLRGWLYKPGLKECGRNFQVTHNVVINTLECFHIGNNVRLGIFSRLNGTNNGECYIGDDVIIGQGSMISCGNHEFNGYNFRDKKPTRHYTTVIGRGSWIGANCTVTAGSHIPCYSLIAANSCVTHKMETQEYAIYGGVPAKFIKVHYSLETEMGGG